MRKWWILGVAVILLIYPLFRAVATTTPSTAQLRRAAEGADRVVIVSTPMTSQLRSVEFHGAATVASLLAEIDVQPPESEGLVPSLFGTRCVYCMCDGDFHINFYRGESLLVSLGYHHDRTIRWRDGPWNTDVYLTNKSRGRVPQWLDAHGYPEMERHYRQNCAQGSP